jgi:hypothetical protein
MKYLQASNERPRVFKRSYSGLALGLPPFPKALPDADCRPVSKPRQAAIYSST